MELGNRKAYSIANGKGEAGILDSEWNRFGFEVR